VVLREPTGTNHEIAWCVRLELHDAIMPLIGSCRV